MPEVYTPEQRTLAKTLMVATGSNEATLTLLSAIWGAEADPGDFMVPSKLPSSRSLSAWKADPRISVDQELLREWSDRARMQVMGASERLTAKAEEALSRALDSINGVEVQGLAEAFSALDALNLAKVFGILADKLNGRYGNAPGQVAPGLNVFGPAQFIVYQARPEPSADA